MDALHGRILRVWSRGDIRPRGASAFVYRYRMRRRYRPLRTPPLATLSLVMLSLAVPSLAPVAAAEEPPEILEPQDTATVPSTFPVTVYPGTYLYCDTDGCFDETFQTIRVEADDEPAGSESVDDPMEVVVEVTLEPGQHTLVAHGEGFLGGPGQSEPVVVMVETGGGTDSGDSDEGGSGCRVSSPRGGAPLLALALLTLFGRRRRRP